MSQANDRTRNTPRCRRHIHSRGAKADACPALRHVSLRGRNPAAPKSGPGRELVLDLTPRKEDLDPIEIASRDEIAALQLQRLKATLRRVYDNVPAYWKKFDAAGVHPDDLNTLADLAKFPFTTKEDLRANYPFGLFAVPAEEILRIHASSGTTGKPTVVGYTKGDIDVWARGGGALDPRLRRPARHEAAQRLRLRAVHRRAWPALRRRAARHGGDPDLGRHDRAAGAAHHRLRARHHHGHALLHAGDPRRIPPSGSSTRARPRSRPASSAPSRGPTPCAPRSSRPSTCTPSTSTACPR